jgi:hypothetical protein
MVRSCSPPSIFPSFGFLFAVFHCVWGSWIAAEVIGGGGLCTDLFLIISTAACAGLRISSAVTGCSGEELGLTSVRSSGPVLAGSPFCLSFSLCSYTRATRWGSRLVGSGRDAECCFVVFSFFFLLWGGRGRGECTSAAGRVRPGGSSGL